MILNPLYPFALELVYHNLDGTRLRRNLEMIWRVRFKPQNTRGKCSLTSAEPIPSSPPLNRSGAQVGFDSERSFSTASNIRCRRSWRISANFFQVYVSLPSLVLQ